MDDSAKTEPPPAPDGSTPAALLVGTIVADRYRVEALLGEGAMGAVFRAQHVHMQKNVALKVLHRETSLNPEVVKRFEREAVAAGRVVHPHVASAQDFGQLADGSFYLVLEYVAGKSLRQVLSEERSLPKERAVHIAQQVAAALAVAHAAGIVHRDLKPENVMLLADADGDFVKVLDFGLAKLGHDESTDTKLTKMGAVYGTPQYMAPEQASGSDVDHRADLYALGVMLYEMLKGEPPFQSDQMVALLVKHMTEEPPALPPSVPADLAQLVMALLQKQPEARPQSAEWLVAELATWLPLGIESSARASLASFGPRLLSTPMVPSTASVVGGPPPRALGAFDRVRSGARALWQQAKEPLTVRGRSFPRGLLLAIPAVLGLSWFALSSRESPRVETDGSVPVSGDDRTASRPIPGPADPELLKVLEAARSGSDAALYALEQRKDDERSAAEWLALCQARLMRRNVDAGLKAFSAAIELDPQAARDEVILGALRALTRDDKDAEPILHFAAEKLGSTGADFLFHVWAKTSAKTGATTLAYDLLDSRAVKPHRSDALRVAMSLREAESCSDYASLLPEITKFGDQRSMMKIRDLELEKTRGCGASKRDDCWPCLREGNALRDATTQASMRAAPQFELSRRFRFLR